MLSNSSTGVKSHFWSGVCTHYLPVEGNSAHGVWTNHKNSRRRERHIRHVQAPWRTQWKLEASVGGLTAALKKTIIQDENLTWKPELKERVRFSLLLQWQLTVCFLNPLQLFLSSFNADCLLIGLCRRFDFFFFFSAIFQTIATRLIRCVFVFFFSSML